MGKRVVKCYATGDYVVLNTVTDEICGHFWSKDAAEAFAEGVSIEAYKIEQNRIARAKYFA